MDMRRLLLLPCFLFLLQAQPVVTPMPVPAHYKTAAAAKPMPQTLPPTRFLDPRVQRAYQVAKEIPAILAQQPCYCYCDRSVGHRSLLDCFKDEHGSHCGVCLKEAMFASKMAKAGFNAEKIREAIKRGEWKTVEL